MDQVIPSARHVRMAIIGGGQLAKMTALSALQFGIDVSIMGEYPDAPAMRITDDARIGNWNDAKDLLRFVERADVVTLENEFVDAEGLVALERAGHALFPTAHSVALLQDKYLQKKTLEAAQLPVAAFMAIEKRDDVAAAGERLGLPLVLKTRRNGYDGKGNATVNDATEIGATWDKLGGDRRALYAEAFCPFVAELAVIITTGRDGGVVVYPLVETVQRNHICHIVRAPAAFGDEVAAAAVDIARRATAAVGAAGSFGVEMFLTKDGGVIVNELAPRVHNSGHYTIEACECSQFENHVRAIMGWSPGSSAMVTPAAVMVNLLGDGDGDGIPQGLNDALSIAGGQAHIHIYGKQKSVPGRKMGHVTALGERIADTEALAQSVADAITFGGKKK